ncbi:TIGR02679 domain-containing protein [Streptosporangium sp. NPDC006013]|uniref:TIGR02679 domain-containing protein n=1 Tax=Streptosporangium sp. NPDC006013 TaxID=3155596 RepID=UPI0033B8B941
MSRRLNPIIDDPAFAPLWIAVHERLSRGEEPGEIATLRVRDLSPVAIAELRGWLDTTTRRRRGRSAVVVNAGITTIPLRELLVILGVPVQRLSTLAERATGRPVVNRAVLRKDAAELRQDLWAYASEQLPNLPGLVARMRSAGLGEDEGPVRRLLTVLADVVTRLPARPPVSLPKLSHDCAGDPHYFDLDTLNGSRLVWAVAELADRAPVRRPDHVRALLAEMGIIADRLSATVLLHNVRVIGDGIIDRRLRDATAPIALTLLDLVEYPPKFAPQTLTVVENPSVLEEALVRGARLPLASTSGHLRGVDHALLQLATDQGVVLRYAGDLDRGGYEIAAQVVEHYGAQIIAMDLDTPEHPVFQEHDAILDLLLRDLC